MSNYTPGPWHWEEGTSTIMRRWNNRDCTVATVNSMTLAWHEDGASASREAGSNAALIAAAPDLLESLQMLVDGFGDTPSEKVAGLAEARAAIRKAMGES